MLLFIVVAAAFPEGSGCAANSDCASGLQCRSNICVLRGTGDSCRIDNDCSAPLMCMNGICNKQPGAVSPQSPPAFESEQPRRLKMKPAKPVRIRYREGDEIPPGGVVVESNLSGLWIAGTVILSLSAAATGLTTTWLCTEGCPRWSTPMSWVPVVGPWANTVVSATEVLPFMLTMALLETAGAGMILGGVFASRQYVVFPNGPGVALSGAF